MDNYKLKIRIGEHEFEAEGPTTVVQSQFQIFKEMVERAPTTPPIRQQPVREGMSETPLALKDAAATDSALSRIMKVENRVVSLTARPKTVDDAALLMLYGQKTLRDNDAVTGSEMIEGLAATGGMNFGRVDRLMEKAATNGDAIVIGERRAKKYRLTNTGLVKARGLAAELIATVA